MNDDLTQMSVEKLRRKIYQHLDMVALAVKDNDSADQLNHLQKVDALRKELMGRVV